VLTFQNAELASRARRAKLQANSSEEVELYKSAMKEVAGRDREIAQLEGLLGTVYEWLPHFAKYSDSVLKRVIKISSIQHTNHTDLFAEGENKAPLPQDYLLDDLRRLSCLSDCGFSISFHSPPGEGDDGDNEHPMESVPGEGGAAKPGLLGEDDVSGTKRASPAAPSPKTGPTGAAAVEARTAGEDSGSALDKEVIKELMMQCQSLQHRNGEWKRKYEELHDLTETKMRRLRAETVSLELQIRDLQERLNMTEIPTSRLAGVQAEIAAGGGAAPELGVGVSMAPDGSSSLASPSKTADLLGSASSFGSPGRWDSTSSVQTIRRFLDAEPMAGLSLSQPVSIANNCLSIQGIQAEMTRLMNLVSSNRTSADGSLWSNASKSVSFIQDSFYNPQSSAVEHHFGGGYDHFEDREDNPSVVMECGLLRSHWKANVNGMVKSSGLMMVHDVSISTLFFQEYCMQYDSTAEASRHLQKLMSSISLWRSVDNRVAGRGISTYTSETRQGMKTLTQTERNMLDMFALLLGVAGKGNKNSVEFNTDMEKFTSTKRTTNAAILANRRPTRGQAGVSSKIKMPFTAASYMRQCVTPAFRQLVFDDIYSRCYCAMQKYMHSSLQGTVRSSPLDLSAGALSSMVPVGELGKILQRVFECTIKSKLLVQSHAEGALALVDEMIGEMPQTHEEDEGANKYDTEGSCVTASDGNLAYIVQYNKNIYKTNWWTYLPSSLFHKLAKNIESLAFKNATTQFHAYDGMLLTWGTIESYHYELRSGIIAAYNFINRMCTSVDLTKTYDSVASTNTFALLCSCLLRGKHAITAPGQGSVVHVADSNGYSALLSEVLADEVIPVPRSTILMLSNLENNGKLNADTFADVMLSMGQESFSKLHALIDCGGVFFGDSGSNEVSDICGASIGTMRLKLRKHLLKEGQMLLDQLRTLILAVTTLRSANAVSSTTPTTSRPSSKESSMRQDGLSSGSAFKKGALIGAPKKGTTAPPTNAKSASLTNSSSTNSTGVVGAVAPGVIRSSFRLKVQTSNTVAAPESTVSAGKSLLPSWARNAAIDEDDDDDDDDESTCSEEVVVSGNAFMEPEFNDEKEDGGDEEEDKEAKGMAATEVISYGPHVVGALEIVLHQAELCFDPVLRATQGIPATFLDVYFSYHGLRRMLHYLYVSGTHGDECLNLLSRNVSAVNHFRYSLLKKVFTKWSLLGFHNLRK